MIADINMDIDTDVGMDTEMDMDSERFWYGKNIL
jgi:hypothetical protein